MADVIHKYGPFLRDPVEYEGRPIHVGIHVDGEIYIWCRKPVVGPDDYTPKGRAKLVMTGEEYTGIYIGTVINRTGFVYHAIAIEAF